MGLLRTLAVGIGLTLLWAGAPVAQTTCPTFPEPPCGQNCSRAHGADVVADLNDMHAAEVPPVPPIILPPTYASASPDQKVIMLINAERRSRNLPALNDAADDNDPVIGYVAENHTKLLAAIPVLTTLKNPNGGFTAHDDAIDGSASERISSIPGSGDTFRFAGEIVAIDDSAEGAVFGWLYGDFYSNWGHRHAILNCGYQFAGAGVAAAPKSGNSTAVTVDFIVSPANNYTMMTLAPGTDKPTPQIYRAITAYLLGDGHNTMSLRFSGHTRPVYGLPNDIKWVYVWTHAVWGEPFQSRPAIGTYPVGSGGLPCPVVARAGEIPDGGVTYTCVMTIPDTAFPVEIDAVDTFSNVLRMKACIPPGSTTPLPGEPPCFQVYPPAPPSVDLPPNARH